MAKGQFKADMFAHTGQIKPLSKSQKTFGLAGQTRPADLKEFEETGSYTSWWRFTFNTEKGKVALIGHPDNHLDGCSWWCRVYLNGVSTPIVEVWPLIQL